MGFKATIVKTKAQPLEVLQGKSNSPPKSKHSPYTPTIRVQFGRASAGHPHRKACVAL